MLSSGGLQKLQAHLQSPAAVGSRLSAGCLLQLPAESVRPLQEPQAESLALQHCQT